MQLVAYLNFAGQCREAFEFYQQALGGELVAMISQGDMGIPGDESSQAQIMHARLVVGDQTLMGSDAPPASQAPPFPVQVSVQIDTAQEAERIYAALVEGGNVYMPLEEQPWAERFGFLTDRFGIPWMINCQKEEYASLG